ncbi:MAG TPA: LysR family transcriptional regulator [Puia sp.]|nr:LysR family transcriptional regulator [Puia sp.]
MSSITKAAEVLNMTQPAVSIQLKKLQDQFDIPLTEIVGRQLYITDFGKELHQIGEKVLADMEDIYYKALAYKGILSGRLRISIVSTGKYVLPYFLNGFLKANPAVEVRADVAETKKAVDRSAGIPGLRAERKDGDLYPPFLVDRAIDRYLSFILQIYCGLHL